MGCSYRYMRNTPAGDPQHLNASQAEGAQLPAVLNWTVERRDGDWVETQPTRLHNGELKRGRVVAVFDHSAGWQYREDVCRVTDTERRALAFQALARAGLFEVQLADCSHCGEGLALGAERACADCSHYGSADAAATAREER